MRRTQSARRTRAFATCDTVYLCKACSGGTFWSNGQCAKQQLKMARQSHPSAQRLSQPPTRTITYTQNTGPDKATECRSLRSQIDNCDAMARQPQRGQVQDWISAQKRRRGSTFRTAC